MSDHEASVEQAIRSVVESINQLWLSRSYEEIGGLVHEDVVVAPPGLEARVVGRDAYVRSYRDYDQAATTHEFSPGEPQIDVVGDVAVAVAPFSIVYEVDGTTHREKGRDILVLSRSGGEWRVAWRTMQTEPAE